jgi:hypothetical protein
LEREVQAELQQVSLSTPGNVVSLQSQNSPQMGVMM